MATIALQYNPRNAVALKTLEYILSLGVFKRADSPVKKAANSAKTAEFYTMAELDYRLDCAEKDIANGNVLSEEQMKQHMQQRLDAIQSQLL